MAIYKSRIIIIIIIIIIKGTKPDPHNPIKNLRGFDANPRH